MNSEMAYWLSLKLADNSLRTPWTNSSKRKPDLGVDQDQQYKITLKTEGKADQTAKDW